MTKTAAPVKEDASALRALALQILQQVGEPDDVPEAAGVAQPATSETPSRASAEAIRARPGWTLVFLQAMATMVNVKRACEIAGVSRSKAYRRRSTDPAFARLWAMAEENAKDALEEEGWRRATSGRRKLVLHKGEPVFVWQLPDGRIVEGEQPGAERVPLYEEEWSDQLLMQQLKRWRPAEYRERHEVRHTDDSDLDQEIKDLTRQLTQQAAATGDAVPQE